MRHNNSDAGCHPRDGRVRHPPSFEEGDFNKYIKLSSGQIQNLGVRLKPPVLPPLGV